MNKKRLFSITAAILVVAVILVLTQINFSPSLTLTDKDSGRTYLEFPMENGDQFSVTFIHSVNQTPVTDIFELRDGEIWLVQTIYYDFGAGVPTELYGDQTFSFGENGELIISNMDTLIPDLIYVVGTVSDHTLSVNGGEEISLRDACGKNSAVRFDYN